MCGIAGIITEHRIEERHQWSMKQMLEAQYHRGPDHSSSAELSDHVLFGHNRLSIIDLSQRAHQPFFSHDRRWVVVFNGEIYNYLEIKAELAPHYPFTTESDTEVLLAAYIRWGAACLEKLIGMFAFALYDAESQDLFLARDRFGVKPLYYAYQPAIGFLFASEIKALHSAGVEKKHNLGLWAAYLTKASYQYQNETFWDGTYQLKAGHYALIDTRNVPNKIAQTNWYPFAHRIKTLQEHTEYRQRSREAHLQYYKSLLEESIKLRFRSDVKVGFNISGGLDSSTLLGAVDQLFPSSDIEAFTFYCNDERYDELPWVKELIEQTNKPLNEVLLTVEAVKPQLEQVAYYQDEPHGGIPTIAYSQIFGKAREKGITVLLDGQGMDEAWAGYDYYHTESNSVVQGVKSSPLKPQVLNMDFAEQAKIEIYPSPFEDSLMNKQYRDLFHTKIPRALRFNDRASMMHSTELREPFLDHRLVEYAFALPNELKTQDRQVKWALRQLAQQYLKGEIHLAPKRPLQTPQREWLTEDLLGWVEERVMALKQNPWFDATALAHEWDAFLKSEKDNTFFLWQWLSV